MDFDSKQLESRTVDGETIRVFNEYVCSRATVDMRVDGLAVCSPSTQSAFRLMLAEVMISERALNIGLRRLAAFPDSWLPITLFSNGNACQRVHLETIVCDACDSLLMIANPDLPDLYFGVRDSRSAMLSAAKMPGLLCPNCHAMLPRHAIWVRVASEVENEQ